MQRSFVSIFAAVLVSMLVRRQFTDFYVVILAIGGPLRVAGRATVLVVLLAAMSAVYTMMQGWFELVVASAELSIENYDEGGSGLFEALLNYQKDGLYLLLFPLKAAHLLFGMGLKFDKLLNPVNIYNDLFVTLHCTVTLLVFLALLKKRLFSLRSDLIFATVVFLAIFCLSPIFAPRYLFPVFLVWALVLAGAPQTLPRRTRVATRRRARSPRNEIRRAIP